MLKQEEGWVVCRVFKKKSNTNNGFPTDHEVGHHDHEEHNLLTPHMELAGVSTSLMMEPITHLQYSQALRDYSLFDGSTHLPQLLSPDVDESMSAVVHHHHHHYHPRPPSFLPVPSLNMLLEDRQYNSQNLLSLTSGSGSCSQGFVQHNEEKFSGDWTFLDKLLASQQSFDQQSKHHSFMSQPANAHHHQSHHPVHSSTQKFPLPFPFHYAGSEPEFLKFSNG